MSVVAAGTVRGWTVRDRMVFEAVTAAGAGRLTPRFALVGKGDRGIPKGGRASE